MKLQDAVITEVVAATTVHSERGRHQTMQERSHWGLSLCRAGQIRYIHNGREFVSDPAHAILLPRGASYLILGDRTGDFPVINFECLGELGETFAVIELREREQALQLYEQIRRLLPFPESRAAVMSLFYRLIDLLRTESCPPRLLPVLRYIREHACDEGGLSNATLARVAGMSEVNFRKQFSAAFQCSPVRYVTELRLQRAKLLLSESDKPVAGIAEACGFSNPYHFCRAFRRHEGVSPSAWRKENRTATLEAL